VVKLSLIGRPPAFGNDVTAANHDETVKLVLAGRDSLKKRQDTFRAHALGFRRTARQFAMNQRFGPQSCWKR